MDSNDDSVDGVVIDEEKHNLVYLGDLSYDIRVDDLYSSVVCADKVIVNLVESVQFVHYYFQLRLN